MSQSKWGTENNNTIEIIIQLSDAPLKIWAENDE
jgi:hypothetical protein